MLHKITVISMGFSHVFFSFDFVPCREIARSRWAFLGTSGKTCLWSARFQDLGDEDNCPQLQFFRWNFLPWSSGTFSTNFEKRLLQLLHSLVFCWLRFLVGILVWWSSTLGHKHLMKFHGKFGSTLPTKKFLKTICLSIRNEICLHPHR